MSWARLEPRYLTNRKVAPMSKDAILLDLGAIMFSSFELRDGVLTEHDVRIVAAEAKVDDLKSSLEEVRRAGRWHRLKAGEVPSCDSCRRGIDNEGKPTRGDGDWAGVPGGWLIHDYLVYNPPRSRVLATRAKDAARMRELRAGRGPGPNGTAPPSKPAADVPNVRAQEHTGARAPERSQARSPEHSDVRPAEHTIEREPERPAERVSVRPAGHDANVPPVFNNPGPGLRTPSPVSEKEPVLLTNSRAEGVSRVRAREDDAATPPAEHRSDVIEEPGLTIDPDLETVVHARAHHFHDDDPERTMLTLQHMWINSGTDRDTFFEVLTSAIEEVRGALMRGGLQRDKHGQKGWPLCLDLVKRRLAAETIGVRARATA